MPIFSMIQEALCCLLFFNKIKIDAIQNIEITKKVNFVYFVIKILK